MRVLKCHVCGTPPFEYCGSCAIKKGFGQPDDTQWAVIERYTRGKQVVDLGAGSCGIAERIAKVAKRVIAVDTNEPQHSRRKAINAAGVEFVRAGFDQVAFDYRRFFSPDTVAVLSWPWGYWSIQSLDGDALLSILARTKRVVYLGKNYNGVVCGGPKLFEHFLRRRLRAHVSRKPNTLLVLGKAQARSRPPTGEEVGGMKPHIIFFEQVTQINSVLQMSGA